MYDALSRVFSTEGFVPRRLCGLWPEWLVLEHVVGNVLVCMAFVAMPGLLLRLGRHHPVWTPFTGVLRAFALFIAFCGFGHFLDLLAFIYPLYRFSGHVLVATGLISCWAAWSLGRAWPALFAMKSPAELERVVALRTEELNVAIKNLRDAEVDASRLATIVESSDDAIVGKNLDGVVTSWNLAAERIFGYTASEAVGRPMRFLFPPDRVDEEATILERLRHGERVNHFESVRLTKDSRPIDVSLTISPIKDRCGRIVGISKIARDITERKRAEASLRLSEQRFEALVELMPQLVVMTNSDGHVCWYNKRWYDYTGTTREQMEGWGWQSVHDPKALPEVLERWQASIRSGEPFEMVFPLRGEDDRFRTFLTRLTPLRDSAGRVLQWFGTSTDIDDQMRAEERIRASERLYRAIGESLPFGVWTCDAEGNNTYASDSFLQLVGQTQEQCSEFGWRDVLHPDDAERTIAAWKECVRTEGTWDIEHRFRGLDGGWHAVLARGVPVRDADGRIICWAGINLDISRLKATEEALRRSEERQRLAMTAARIAHWEWDIAADRIPYQNSLSLLYDRPDDRPFANLSDFLSIVHPDDRAPLHAAALRAMTPDVPYQIDYRIVLSDGSVRWLAGRGGTHFGDDGAPLRMVGINFDITRSKESEAQIRRMNEDLEQRVRDRTAELSSANATLAEQAQLLDLAHDTIMVRSMQAEIIFWNKGAERMYGWTTDEAVGKVTHGLLKTRFPVPLEQIEAELADNGYWEGELIHSRRDGTPLVVASRWVLQRDEQGKPRAYLEINNDITERKRAQEQFQRQTALLRSILDNMSDGVVVSDSEDRFLEFNPAAEQMFGGGATSVKSAEWPEHYGLFLPDAVTPFPVDQLPLLRAIDGEEVDDIEMFVQNERVPMGRWVMVNGRPFSNGRSERSGGIAVCRDITVRKRMELELSRSNAELEQFAFIASHDLQEPLRLVSSFTQLLAKKYAGQLDDEANEYIGFAVDGCRRMQGLIRDLLEFSRVGRRSRPIELISSEDVLARTLVDLRSTIADVGAIITHDPLPVVRGESGLLGRLFQNFIGNALKFHSAAPPRVNISVRRDGALWIFGVADNGIGIDPQYFQRIFDIFQRLHTRDEYAGNGLGLAVCKRIVEHHGGRIWVESTSGQGSTFYFSMPTESLDS